MNPASRRRIYLFFAPLGWVAMAVTWVLQQTTTPVIRITYPILVIYLIVAWMYLRFRRAEVVTVERSTFWMLAVFWNITMAVRLTVATDPDLAWRGLSPSVFMGLTILVVMAFLWFDTGAALFNALLLPVASSIIGLLYFVPHPGPQDVLLIDLIRYEIYLVIIVVFVFALARSKDALLDARLEAEHMRAMAYHDPLTGLSNRRQALDELNLLADSGSAAGVVLLDLDEFKLINDRYGHDVGDVVLTGVADVLRTVDARLASRWGGEEFLLVFDGGRQDAAEAAERVRELLAAATFPDQIRLTASFGVAALSDSTPLPDVLRQADDQLYRAKSDGRNLVRVELR